MPNGNLDVAPPPYMSTSLLTGAIATFANSVVPTALDRHVLSTMSGADYGSLISGMRFLGLVEPGGTRPTEAFKKLVKAREVGDDDYKSALLMVINDPYRHIVGNVDIDSGTLSELEKAFRDYGVPQGQMLKKTVRFYVKAIQECGIVPSPHITKPRRPTNKRAPNGPAGPRKPKGNKATGHPPPLPPPPDNPVPGFERMPIPGIAGGFIQYPTDLDQAGCEMYKAVVGVLGTYVAGRSGKKGG